MNYKLSRSEVLVHQLHDIALRIFGPTMFLHRWMYIALAYVFGAISIVARRLLTVCARGAATVQLMEELYQERRRLPH